MPIRELLRSGAVGCVLLACVSFTLVDCSRKVNSVEDYYVRQIDLGRELESIDKGRSFTAFVIRRFETDEERDLIKLAEATYPTSELILKDRGKHIPPSQMPPLAQDGLWWWSSFDGMRIPYALTRGAVDYYLGLIDAFERSRSDSLGTPPMIHAELLYTAEVKWQDRFERENHRYKDVFVVTMECNWSAYCGNLCALRFTKSRIVVLGRGGVLRAVFGDGYSSYTVS